MAKLLIYTVFSLTSWLLLSASINPQTPTAPPTPPVTISPPEQIYLPQNRQSLPPPPITAKGAIVYEPATKQILYHQSATTHLPHASTTKIMTALVSLDAYSLATPLIVTTADQAIGSKAELIAGEPLTVESILYALLVSSGNDAAVTLAQNYPGGYPAFVTAMNQKAQDLGLVDTHYTNTSGIDHPDHYSSALDVAKLTAVAMGQSQFRLIVQTQTYTLTDIYGQHPRVLTNLNQLLGQVSGVIGVKTGWSQSALECLATYTLRDQHPLIVVVLGSQDRFGESTALIEWAYQTYIWEPVAKLN